MSNPPPSAMRDWIAILDQPLPTIHAIDFVTDPAAGGVGVFLGTTREENSASDKTLIALDYEAYQEMAIPQMTDLADRARQRWPVIKIAILHRIGRVDVGQPSVVIAVSCPHREEAFESCRFLIDTLKAEVTIWKKEVWADGTTSWVDPSLRKPQS